MRVPGAGIFAHFKGTGGSERLDVLTITLLLRWASGVGTSYVGRERLRLARWELGRRCLWWRLSQALVLRGSSTFRSAHVLQRRTAGLQRNHSALSATVSQAPPRAPRTPAGWGPTLALGTQESQGSGGRGSPRLPGPLVEEQ